MIFSPLITLCLGFFFPSYPLWLKRCHDHDLPFPSESAERFHKVTFYTYKRICCISLEKNMLGYPIFDKITSPWSRSWEKSKSKITRNQQNFTILLFWLVNKNSDDLQLVWVPPAVRSAPCFQRFWLPGWPGGDIPHRCYNSQIRRYFTHVLYLFKHMSAQNIN